MPFQTRRSATLAPERKIKLLIPSVDIWQPPPAQPTAEAGGGSQGISVRYPYLSKPHIQWYAGTYPHIYPIIFNIYIQWFPYISHVIHFSYEYPRHIHIITYQMLSRWISTQDIHVWICHYIQRSTWITLDMSWISHGNLWGYPCKISAQDINVWICSDTWIYRDLHG